MYEEVRFNSMAFRRSSIVDSRRLRTSIADSRRLPLSSVEKGRRRQLRDLERSLTIDFRREIREGRSGTKKCQADNAQLEEVETPVRR